ncbi:hypothetical protein BDF14DRAFT_1746954 [Spinellus fusiger]|nr:hypothetical protein BDF14DRAFT_1746954 [Spinellus fusiger]
MDYPFYLAIYYYISARTYPTNSDEATKRKIRHQAQKYMTTHRKVFQKSEESNILGPELLHKGIVDEVVKKVHAESHFGVNNTWRQLKMQYTGPALFEQSKGVLSANIEPNILTKE